MGGSSTQTQQTTTAPTALAGQNYTSAINQAAQLATTPYNTATDTQVAGLTQPQTTAFGQLQSAYGTAQPYLSQATNYANAAADPATVQNNIQGFENPYTSSVINSSLALANQQNQQQQQQLQSSAASAGALGGDRLGVAQGVLGGQQALANNQLISGLNQQNYSQALGASQQNAAAQGQSAYTLGNLGQEALNTDITGAQAGLSAGNQLQAQQQNVLNSGTQNAVQQTQFPYQNTQYLASILGSLGPLLGGTTQGTTTTPVNYLGQILGAGLAGASLIPSDKRVKEDIQPIGKTFDGQTITKFRYKGDNTTRIGLIAQDVEKKHPDSVSEINGIKAVDYDKATEDSAKKGHFANGGMVPFRQHRDTGGSVFNLNSGPYGMSDALSAGRGNFPSLPQTPSNQNNANSFGSQIQQMSQMASLGKSAGTGLSNLNNNLGTSVFGSQPTQGPGGWSTSVQPSGGFLGGIGDSLGFAKGGQVKGYDDGGTVTPDDASLGIPAGSSPLSFSDAGNWLARQSGYQQPYSGESMAVPIQPYQASAPAQISPNSPLATMPATPFSPSELDQVANQYNAPVVPSLTNENLFKDMPAETASAPVTSLGQTSSPAPAQFSQGSDIQSSPTGISPNGLDFIKKQEGFSANPYDDYKQSSIGYGTKALPGDKNISPEEGESRLVDAAKPVSNWIQQNVKVPMTQGQFDALASFGYNTGIGSLNNIKNDINSGDWNTVADHIKQYVNAGGAPSDALKTRRELEANMITGNSDSGLQDSVSSSTPQQKTSFLSRLGLTDSSGAEATPDGKGILAKLGVPDVNPLGLSDNQRNSLLMAGLSMMAAGPAMGTRSPIGALTTVGKGAVQGMNTYLTEQQQEKAAQAKAAQLAQQAQQHQSQLAETSRHNVATEGYLKNAYASGMVPDPNNPGHLMPGSWTRDANGNPVAVPGMVMNGPRGSTTAQPAQVRTAQWLVDNKIAPDLSTAYGLVHSGVNDANTFTRAVQAEKNRISNSTSGSKMSDADMETQARNTILSRAKMAGDQALSRAQPQQVPVQNQPIPSAANPQQTTSPQTQPSQIPHKTAQDYSNNQDAAITKARYVLKHGADPAKVQQTLQSLGVPDWKSKQLLLDSQVEKNLG